MFYFKNLRPLSKLFTYGPLRTRARTVLGTWAFLNPFLQFLAHSDPIFIRFTSHFLAIGIRWSIILNKKVIYKKIVKKLGKSTNNQFKIPNVSNRFQTTWLHPKCIKNHFKSALKRQSVKKENFFPVPII